MRSGNYHPVNFESRFSKIMGRLRFRRHPQKAAQKSTAGARPSSTEWAQTFWGRKFIKSTTLALALFCSASVALADIKVTTKSSAGGQSYTSTTYIKGARQRTEGMGYTMIYQCDLKRMIQINDKTRTYFITPLGGGAGAGSAKTHGGHGSTRRGGVVTYTTTVEDTGERKEMFGLTAKHLKTKTVVEASEGACTPMNMEMESDGWYVDMPGGLECTTDSPAPQFSAGQSDCVDEIRYKTQGTAKMGYPVMTTTRMKFNMGADAPAASMPTQQSMQEVVEFSKSPLSAALFDIPAGYTEVKSAQELGSPY